MSARRVAFDVLRRVFEDGAYADRAFRAAADSAGLDQRDRAFAMQLAYGSVQRKRTLDHAISTLGKRPARKLDPPVLAALRLGAYQVGFLHGVPPHAAANESVELVRAPGSSAPCRSRTRSCAGWPRDSPRCSSRSATRRRPMRRSSTRIPTGSPTSSGASTAARRALALMEAMNEPPPTVVRVTARGRDLPGERDPELPAALTVDQIPQEWLAEGLVWPQSRGSQLAGLAVGAQPGERILDLCAAPGGKTTLLAEIAAEVVAVEKHEGRARELSEHAARLGLTNITVVHADALELPAHLTGFDRVLVDAPCSGTGVLASRPDLRWRGDPLPDLQRSLLTVAAERVRPGGSVTYAVCALNAAENEDVVDAAGLAPDDWARLARLPPSTPAEFLLTLPHVHRTSGFFIARMRA